MIEPNSEGEPFEVPEPSTGGGGAFFGTVGLVIGLIGVACGLVGIYLASNARSEVAAFRAELEGRPDPTTELRDSLDSRYEDVDTRLVRFGEELGKVGQYDRQLRSIREDSQRAFDSVIRDIRANRTGINELSAKVEEVVAGLNEVRSGGGRPSQASPPEGGSTAASGESLATAPEDGVYTIQSGDTMSNIASRYRIPLARLLDANPGVDPKRLQVGQRIVLPTP